MLKTDLSEDQLKRARLRAEHVLEAETGYRAGHSTRALPGEPRPEYDPALTTVTERRRAKAADRDMLKALAQTEGGEAARAALRVLELRTPLSGQG
ncbi:hypothetical protein ACIQZO_37705 [Streptomyces sp. NPDC097617]|uniref:hypothetical protein n=1 Tax=Streptomyces sp. NPDC097617 TaxID=3366091 RepID=UPI00381A198A